jgi:hypothetical protein
LHFLELYRLDLDSHPHSLSEEILDISRRPELGTIAIKAHRANVETTKSRSVRSFARAFLGTCHYSDFIPIIKARNCGDHITVKTVRLRPGMGRSLPTAMPFAKRIKLVKDAPRPAS